MSSIQWYAQIFQSPWVIDGATETAKIIILAVKNLSIPSDRARLEQALERREQVPG